MYRFMRLALHKCDLHRPLFKCMFVKNCVHFMGTKLYDKLPVIHIVFMDERHYH